MSGELSRRSRSCLASSTPVPVVAAGGIADGRGLAAVLALGAVGAWVGTRLLAARDVAIESADLRAG